MPARLRGSCLFLGPTHRSPRTIFAERSKAQWMDVRSDPFRSMLLASRDFCVSAVNPSLHDLLAPLHDLPTPLREMLARFRELPAGLREVPAGTHEFPAPLHDLLAPLREMLAPFHELLAGLRELLAGLREMKSPLPDYQFRGRLFPDVRCDGRRRRVPSARTARAHIAPAPAPGTGTAVARIIYVPGNGASSMFSTNGEPARCSPVPLLGQFKPCAHNRA
jgi:hypothetical protein